MIIFETSIYLSQSLFFFPLAVPSYSSNENGNNGDILLYENEAGKRKKKDAKFI